MTYLTFKNNANLYMHTSDAYLQLSFKASECDSQFSEWCASNKLILNTRKKFAWNSRAYRELPEIKAFLKMALRFHHLVNFPVFIAIVIFKDY